MSREDAISVRRDRQLGAAWMPEMPSTARRLAVEGDPLAALRAGICPFCGAGPYTVVAGHTQRMHGVDRFALRDHFGLTFGVSICDPAYSKALAKRASEALEKNPDLLAAGRVGHKKVNRSKAWWRIQREKIERVSSDEQRRDANKTAVRRSVSLKRCSAPGCCNFTRGNKERTCSEACKQENVSRKGFASVRPSKEARQRGVAKMSQTRRKPHPCPICNEEVPEARQRWCSESCRTEALRRQSEKLIQRNKAMAAAKTPVIPTCHPDRPHAALGLCNACYKRDWNERHSSRHEALCEP